MRGLRLGLGLGDGGGGGGSSLEPGENAVDSGNVPLLYNFQGTPSDPANVPNLGSEGGTPALIGTSPVLSSQAVGGYTSSADFTSGNKGVRQPYPGNLSYCTNDATGPICYEMIVRLASLNSSTEANQNSLISTRPNLSAAGMVLLHNDAGNLQFVAWKGGAAVTINIISTNALVINTDYHIVAQRDEDLRTWNLYVGECGSPMALWATGAQDAAAVDVADYEFDVGQTEYSAGRFSSGHFGAVRITRDVKRYNSADFTAKSTLGLT